MLCRDIHVTYLEYNVKSGKYIMREISLKIIWGEKSYFRQIRTWGNSPYSFERNEDCMKKQTFILEINDCQNESWQGKIEWIQGQKREYFRSVIELLRLIESAVNEKEASDVNTECGQRDGR